MLVTIILLSLFTFVCTAFFLVDAVPLFNRWQGRIHIGRWQDGESWHRAAAAVCSKWLKKMPAIPVTDKERLTIIERLRGTYTAGNFSEWQAACMIIGSGDKAAVNACADSFFTPDGDLRRTDITASTAMLLFAVSASPLLAGRSFEKAQNRTAEYLFESAAKHGGTVPYTASLPEVRFVDTLGMICPFLMQYALGHSSPSAMEIAVRQLDEYMQNGIHENLGIPVHSFDKRNFAPLGVYGWGRGCGWLATALCDCFDTVDGSGEYAAVAEKLLGYMVSYADSLLEFVLPNGGFSDMLLFSSSGESSATAMLGRMFACLAQKTGEEKYSRAAAGSLGFLKAVTRRSGEVDLAQGDTMSIAAYSVRRDVMPAAQGLALDLYGKVK